MEDGRDDMPEAGMAVSKTWEPILPGGERRQGSLPWSKYSLASSPEWENLVGLAARRGGTRIRFTSSDELYGG